METGKSIVENGRLRNEVNIMNLMTDIFSLQAQFSKTFNLVEDKLPTNTDVISE